MLLGSLLMNLGFAAAMMWLGPQVAVGDLAMDFRLKNFEGEDVTLRQFRGKVVLLDFWASWSPSSRRSLSEFVRLSKKYSDEGLVLLAVNVDSRPTNAVKFLREQRVEITPLWDSRKKVVSIYEVRKMPTSYLIDRSGVVRFIQEGFSEEDVDKFEKRIRRLLRDTAVAQQLAQP
jgi:peroxiredoxin